ncbi:MAG: hypothetical protein PHU56_01220 [Candidatus Pacebacteria bacterium]|nr:hypothetical protein [Candidatus Paceibacterota bacterium]
MALSIPPDIRVFLERIVDERGYKNITPELREQIISSLFPRLQAFLMADVAKHLPDNDARELDKMLEDGQIDQEKATAFFKERIKNLDEILAGAMLEFRAVYLNG